jgi:hypothetical protein
MTSTYTSYTEAPRLICFSHLRWNFVYQRPQHLLSRAATDYRVVFFEEPIFEADTEPTLRLIEQQSGVVVATPTFPADYSRALVDGQLRVWVNQVVGDEACELVFWYYTPMALVFSDHIHADVCVYDCMDELSAFRGAPVEMREYEQKLFAQADLVFCGGASLYESKRHDHHSVHAFPSSVDRAHFAKARELTREEPSDQRQIAHPRIGFFGVIDERLDLPLIEQLADRRPDWQLILVGPVAKIDPASLPERPNIHFLGGKGYDRLPDYMGGWDAGFMPFALNEATRFISPTKTPEFLSAGLPIVSTPIADVVKPYGVDGLVEIATNSAEMSDAIDMCLNRQDDQWRRRVERKLSGMSWDKTWAAMNVLIERKLRSPSKVPKPDIRAVIYV